MEKIIFISQISNNKSYCIEYPFTEEYFNYLQAKFKNEDNEQNYKNELVNEKDGIIQNFIIKNNNNNKVIFDLIIDKNRYISFPIWIEKNKYYEDLTDSKLINQNKNIFKKGKNNEPLLIMFNIIFVLDKVNTFTLNKDLIKNISVNIESISKIFLFEEYRKQYLSKELSSFINLNKKFFNDKNKENIRYSKYKDIISNKLLMNLKNIYEGIKNNQITKIFINNLEFRYNFQITISNSNHHNIQPYHSAIIQKEKEVIEFFRENIDINPILLLILDNFSPFKSIEEISLEYNIHFSILIFFINQLISWNFAKLIFKIGNNSLFEVSSNINYENKIIQNHISPMDVFTVFEIFTFAKPGTNINSLYSNSFESTMDKGKFLNMLIYLLQNNYLILTSIIIDSILPFKFEYFFEKFIFDSLNNFQNKKNSKMFFEDVNINEKPSNGNKKTINLYNYKRNNDIVYYEDILLEIKEKSIDDYYLLNSITSLIQKKMYIEEISYYSNYKINEILQTIEKYPELFNIIIVPI